LTIYESGLCVWNEETARFEQHRVLWTKTTETPEPPLAPDGHAVFWTDTSGENCVLFGDPFPRLKCSACFDAWSDPETWEALKPQPSVRCVADDERITPHRGSIAWNSYRKKWVAVFTQLYGRPSAFGEIWYAEADRPTGPWGPAIKVVTHTNYTFYNPRLHPEFTSADSPILLFEATFTRQFSGNPAATPRHDYNQILYRLDLDDQALLAITDFEIGRIGGQSLTAAIGKTDEAGHANFGIVPIDASYESIKKAVLDVVKRDEYDGG
jgi:hypothetical protein